jgi:patatin-like phospholipase/acyl hydrolase
MRILAIDGGGIRGIYAAYILNRIAEEFGITFCKCFDLVVGTSTGAIIAAALATNHPIPDVLKLYEKNGRRIFKKQLGGVLGLLKSRYNNRPLKAHLDQIFGDKTMSDVQTRLMIPATDIGNGQVFVFKSNYLEEFVRDKNIKIADAVLASCSAPTYFNPIEVKEYLLADGGLWANNPSMAALIEATGKMKTPVEKVRLLSVGTGIGNRYYPRKSANRRWRKVSGFFGLSFYGTKLVEVLLNLQSKSAQNMMGLLLDETQYLRLNFESDNKLSLDSVETIDDLKSRADQKFTYKVKAIGDFLRACEGE